MTLQIDVLKELAAAHPTVRAVLEPANHTRKATWAITLPHQAMSAKKLGERFHEAFHGSPKSVGPALTWLRRRGLLTIERNGLTPSKALYKRAKERLLIPVEDLHRKPSHRKAPSTSATTRLAQLAADLEQLSTRLTQLVNEVSHFEEAMSAAAHAFNAIREK